MDKDEYEGVEETPTKEMTSEETEETSKDATFEFKDWAII